jgi:hypothetical protein
MKRRNGTILTLIVEVKMNDTKILELITELREWKTEQKRQERKVHGPSGYNGRYIPRLDRIVKEIRKLESALMREIYNGVR